MKLQDLLPEHLRSQLKKEAIDLPPDYVQYVQHHTKSPKQDFYHNSTADFRKLKHARDFEVTQDFMNYIKSLENSIHKGYKKSTGRWYPIDDPNGQFKVIAYGHKIPSGDENEYANGVTDGVAGKLLHNDLESASRKVKSYISSRFGDVDMTNEQMEMLTDFAFELGGLNAFPKFIEAVVKKDWNTANKEYKRSYVDRQGQRHELTTRNTAFYNRYLYDKVA